MAKSTKKSPPRSLPTGVIIFSSLTVVVLFLAMYVANIDMEAPLTTPGAKAPPAPKAPKAPKAAPTEELPAHIKSLDFVSLLDTASSTSSRSYSAPIPLSPGRHLTHSTSTLPPSIFATLLADCELLAPAPFTPTLSDMRSTTYDVGLGVSSLLIEQVIEHLSHSVKAQIGEFYPASPPFEITHAEWYLRRTSPTGDMPVSPAVDSSLFTTQNLAVPPVMSSELFLTESGGATIVVNQTVHEPSTATTNLYLATPLPNKLLLTRGDLLTGVLGDLTRYTDSDRLSLVVHWWPGRPYNKPVGLPEDVGKRLSEGSEGTWKELEGYTGAKKVENFIRLDNMNDDVRNPGVVKKGKTYEVELTSIAVGFTWEHYTKTVRMFSDLDVAPRNGAVTVTEFAAAVPEPNTKEVFDGADDNKDGIISLPEYVYAMITQHAAAAAAAAN